MMMMTRNAAANKIVCASPVTGNKGQAWSQIHIVREFGFALTLLSSALLGKSLGKVLISNRPVHLC